MTDRERERSLTIASADELLRASTRRGFLRVLAAGGTITLIPGVFASCAETDPLGPPGGGTPGNNLDSITFDLRTDAGIFRLTHTLEIVERAFYTSVVTKSDFSTMFNADEREVLVDIRNAETIHEAFLRNALGSMAVPDLTSRLNTTTLATILSSKANILATARLLEHTGVATLNGAGKYIKDARNLLVAGKFASVEARHAAALRDIAPPAGVNANTAFAGDDIIDANGRDVKNEPQAALTRVRAQNVIAEPLNSNISISNAPTATQGTPPATPDLFPANP